MDPTEAHDVVIVTGLSGAGRTTVIRALEDLGREAVDNLPLALIPRLIEPGSGRALALGIDSRTRGFSTEALIDAVSELRATPGVAPTLLFVDATDDALIKRYAETRRRHPMAPEEGVAIGVERERAVLSALRERADLVIDTTNRSPHDLKGAVRRRLSTPGAQGLSVAIRSFAFKRGAPREADMVMDVRFLRNPHWDAALRPFDGRDDAVRAYIAEDPLYDVFFRKLCDMMLLLLPAYAREGKSYFCLGIGCSGGRHRSVAISERLKAKLVEEGWRVSLRHRELENQSDAPLAAPGDAA